MSRKGENIYKRRDGRWEGHIKKADGKYKYVYAKTYKEVREKKKNYDESAHENKPASPATDAAGLFEYWLESVKDRVKPQTYQNYDCCIQKYVLPFFSKTGNERITKLSSTQFAKSIRDNDLLSQSYKKKLLTIFKTALREMLKGTDEFFSITEAVKLPKAENAEIQVFSINEQRLIENAALYYEDVKALGILLCFYTGIRIGELCALKYSDLDFEARTMHITKTVSRIKNYRPEGKKTILLVGTTKSQKSVRNIPLPDFLMRLSYERNMQWTKGDCYLLSGTNTPTDPRTYQKLYKKVLKSAGVKDRKFHAIRHTFATRALELGIDIKTLSEILGHSSVSITLNVYAHSLLEQKRIAMDRLNNLYVKYMSANGRTNA